MPRAASSSIEFIICQEIILLHFDRVVLDSIILAYCVHQDIRINSVETVFANTGYINALA